MLDASYAAGYSAPLDAILKLACSDMVAAARTQLTSVGVVHAVKERKAESLFIWLATLFAFQGISDRAATTFQLAHGQVSWPEVMSALASPVLCPRLRSWWHFRCGYRKTSGTCAEPDFIVFCGLPRPDLRKGVLNEAAFGLALFIRDVCDGDLVGWIDQRLALLEGVGTEGFGRTAAKALVEPLAEIPGTGPKLWNMLLADLLLAADPDRERWVATGASMIAIDTLVHAWLHRTGILRRYGATHPYGPRCYGPNGCAAVIEQIALTVDARAFNPSYPSYFPRFVQVAIWEFCSEGGRNICNGRQIDDRERCRQIFCPAHDSCARIPLRP